MRTARAFVTWKRDAAYYGQAAWRGRWATEGGGVMINQAIHTLDLLLLLAGRPVQVEGTIANRHLREEIEVEDTAEMHIELAKRRSGRFLMHQLPTGPTRRSSSNWTAPQARLRLEGDAIQLLDRNGQPQNQKKLDELLAAVRLFVPLAGNPRGSGPERQSFAGVWATSA